MLVYIHSRHTINLDTTRDITQSYGHGTRPNQHSNLIRTSAPFMILRSLATFARALKAAHSFIIVAAFLRAAFQPAMLTPRLLEQVLD